MSGGLTDQTLALGGVFQAAHLVQQIASRGRGNEPALEASLESLFRFDAASASEVFGGVPGILDGLRTLVRQLGDEDGPRDTNITRYALSLLQLERRLLRSRALTETVHAGLKATAARLDFFPLTHANTVAGLADLYQQTVSTLSPRILVTGEQNHLANPDNASRIRAALLAGIRAAVLWRQSGGSRLGLLLGRRRYVAEARRLLERT